MGNSHNTSPFFQVLTSLRFLPDFDYSQVLLSSCFLFCPEFIVICEKAGLIGATLPLVEEDPALSYVFVFLS